MGHLDDRLKRLEGRLRPYDAEAERQWQQDLADLDRIAAIIRDSGESFDNTLSRVQELHPEWSHYQQQLETKKLLILAAPDGKRLWARFAALLG